MAQLPAAPSKEPGWVKAFVTNEPLIVSSLIAAIGVFSTIRWGTSKADLISQLTAGLLPIVLGVIARMYVTPVAKVKTPDELATWRQQLTQLQTQVDVLVSGNIRRIFDQLIAAAFGAISPGEGLPTNTPVGTPIVTTSGFIQTGDPQMSATINGEPVLPPPTIAQVAADPPPAG